jgi:hypothetical protein
LPRAGLRPRSFYVCSHVAGMIDVYYHAPLLTTFKNDRTDFVCTVLFLIFLMFLILTTSGELKVKYFLAYNQTSYVSQVMKNQTVVPMLYYLMIYDISLKSDTIIATIS